MEPAEDSDGTDGRWRIARKVAPYRVISTVDTEGAAHPQEQVAAAGRVLRHLDNYAKVAAAA